MLISILRTIKLSSLMRILWMCRSHSRNNMNLSSLIFTAIIAPIFCWILIVGTRIISGSFLIGIQPKCVLKPKYSTSNLLSQRDDKLVIFFYLGKWTWTVDNTSKFTDFAENWTILCENNRSKWVDSSANISTRYDNAINYWRIWAHFEWQFHWFAVHIYHFATKMQSVWAHLKGIDGHYEQWHTQSFDRLSVIYHW